MKTRIRKPLVVPRVREPVVSASSIKGRRVDLSRFRDHSFEPRRRKNFPRVEKSLAKVSEIPSQQVRRRVLGNGDLCSTSLTESRDMNSFPSEMRSFSTCMLERRSWEKPASLQSRTVRKKVETSYRSYEATADGGDPAKTKIFQTATRRPFVADL